MPSTHTIIQITYYKQSSSKDYCQSRHPRRQIGRHRPRQGPGDAGWKQRVVRSAQTHPVTSFVESLSIDRGESQLKPYRLHFRPLLRNAMHSYSHDFWSGKPWCIQNLQSLQIYFIITETNLQNGCLSKWQFLCLNQLNTILLQHAITQFINISNKEDAFKKRCVSDSEMLTKL